MSLEKINKEIVELIDEYKTSGTWNWERVHQSSIAVSNLESARNNLMSTHFSPDQMRQAAELRDELGDEYIEKLQERWARLLADIEVARGTDVKSAAAKSLAARWDELQAETVTSWQQAPGMPDAIADGYRTGAFDDVPQAPGKETFEFIQRIRDAGTPS